VAQLADARTTLAEELGEALESLERAEVVTAAVADVLDGSRYLVLAANNAEMQNGWGMPLSAGVLEVVDGALSLDAMEPTSDLLLPRGVVPVTGDLADTWSFIDPSSDFRNLAVTASFDQAAPVAAAMWEALGRGPVDGVLAIDPLALRAILATTGPVESAAGQVSADEVVPLMLHDAYVLQADLESGIDARRDEQSDVAVAAVRAATAPGTDMVQLGRNLAAAAENRHVMLWSSDERQQAAWVAAGVDGGLREDSLLIGAANRAGNKVDWFLDVGAVLVTQPTADGVEVTVDITMTNRTPDGEPQYVVGPFDPEKAGLAAGDWRGFLTAHIPGAATDVRIDDLVVVVDGRSGPTRIVSAVTLVPKGETRTHVVRFTMPPGASVLTVEPSARVNPISWVAGSEAWRDDDGARSLALGS
jgi:hypothetical protein